MSTVMDNFNTEGEIIQEAEEFADIKVADFIDKRTKVTPSFSDSRTTHIDVELNRVTFYRFNSIVYGHIEYDNGVETILFKCRQKKNLTRFISAILEMASWDTRKITREYRTY